MLKEAGITLATYVIRTFNYLFDITLKDIKPTK